MWQQKEVLELLFKVKDHHGLIPLVVVIGSYLSVAVAYGHGCWLAAGIDHII